MACSAFMMLSFDSAAACKIPSGLAGPAAALSRLDVTVGMIFFLVGLAIHSFTHGTQSLLITHLPPIKIPVVLTKLLIMWFYWTLSIEAAKVFAKYALKRELTGRLFLCFGEDGVPLDYVTCRDQEGKSPNLFMGNQRTSVHRLVSECTHFSHGEADTACLIHPY